MGLRSQNDSAFHTPSAAWPVLLSAFAASTLSWSGSRDTSSACVMVPSHSPASFASLSMSSFFTMSRAAPTYLCASQYETPAKCAMVTLDSTLLTWLTGLRTVLPSFHRLMPLRYIFKSSFCMDSSKALR